MLERQMKTIQVICTLPHSGSVLCICWEEAFNWAAVTPSNHFKHIIHLFCTISWFEDFQATCHCILWWNRRVFLCSYSHNSGHMLYHSATALAQASSLLIFHCKWHETTMNLLFQSDPFCVVLCHSWSLYGIMSVTFTGHYGLPSAQDTYDLNNKIIVSLTLLVHEIRQSNQL